MTELEQLTKRVCDLETIVNQNKDIMNTSEVARFIGVSVAYIKANNKNIPHYKKGGLNIYDKSEIKKWLKTNKIKTAKEINSEAATIVTLKSFKN